MKLRLLLHTGCITTGARGLDVKCADEDVVVVILVFFGNGKVTCFIILTFILSIILNCSTHVTNFCRPALQTADFSIFSYSFEKGNPEAKIAKGAKTKRSEYLRV